MKDEMIVGAWMGLFVLFFWSRGFITYDVPNKIYLEDGKHECVSPSLSPVAAETEFNMGNRAVTVLCTLF